MKTLPIVAAIIAVSLSLASASQAQSSQSEQAANTPLKNYLTVAFHKADTEDSQPYDGSINYSAKRVGKTGPHTFEGYEQLLSRGVLVTDVANHIAVNVEGYEGYTKAELIFKKTNAVLMDVPLTEEKQLVNISQLPSGDYRLVLSNDAGKIMVEKLIIF